MPLESLYLRLVCMKRGHGFLVMKLKSSLQIILELLFRPFFLTKKSQNVIFKLNIWKVWASRVRGSGVGRR